MACFLYRDAVECTQDCESCPMMKHGYFDGEFNKRMLNSYAVEYCCKVCRRFKKTDIMNSVLKDNCYDCEFAESYEVVRRIRK